MVLVTLSPTTPYLDIYFESRENEASGGQVKSTRKLGWDHSEAAKVRGGRTTASQQHGTDSGDFLTTKTKQTKGD